MSLHEVLLIYNLAASWCNKPHLANNIFDVVSHRRSVPKCRKQLISCLKEANDSPKVEACFVKIDEDYE